MTTIALGAARKQLRKDRGLTLHDVAGQTGTSASQIARIEAGDGNTRASLFFAVVRAVRGNVTQLRDLLLDAHTTEEDGIRLAADWLHTQSTATSTVYQQILDQLDGLQ